MHISSVTVKNFRGLDLTVPVVGPFGMIAGPNNAGKSAIVDAIRSVLYPYSGRSGQRWIVPTDFTRASSVGEAASELSITLQMEGIDNTQSAQLLSILAPKAGVGVGRLTLRAKIGRSGRIQARYFGGDFDANEVESIAKESLRFVYMPPLRDAAEDMRPGAGNRLATLVSAYAPTGHSDRDSLTSIMADANERLIAVPAIARSADEIQRRITAITGRGPFAHKSGLSFSEARYERIVSALQALGGDVEVANLIQNGLGYNNLLYIAVLLAALAADDAPTLNVLLIEEPEAHLHPQLQGLLTNYLESLSESSTQVIVTTHSAQFAASAQISRLTVLAKERPGVSANATNMAALDLTDSERRYLARFLDVTRSALLFAQRVILVEGIAEQLLLPALARRLGINLSQLGVSVVNVAGVGFAPFLKLFGPGSLSVPCVAITDGDEDDDGEVSDVARNIKAYEQIGRRVIVGRRTLEWDLAATNYSDREALLSALARVRPRLAAQMREKQYGGEDEFADDLLHAIEKHKGIFAQELADVLDAGDATFEVPSTLEDALRWIELDANVPDRSEPSESAEDNDE